MLLQNSILNVKWLSRALYSSSKSALLKYFWRQRYFIMTSQRLDGLIFIRWSGVKKITKQQWSIGVRILLTKYIKLAADGRVLRTQKIDCTFEHKTSTKLCTHSGIKICLAAGPRGSNLDFLEEGWSTKLEIDGIFRHNTNTKLCTHFRGSIHVRRGMCFAVLPPSFSRKGLEHKTRNWWHFSTQPVHKNFDVGLGQKFEWMRGEGIGQRIWNHLSVCHFDWDLVFLRFVVEKPNPVGDLKRVRISWLLNIFWRKY